MTNRKKAEKVTLRFIKNLRQNKGVSYKIHSTHQKIDERKIITSSDLVIDLDELFCNIPLRDNENTR